MTDKVTAILVFRTSTMTDKIKTLLLFFRASTVTGKDTVVRWTEELSFWGVSLFSSNKKRVGRH